MSEPEWKIVECGSRMLLDMAEVKIQLPDATGELYMTNAQCYECAEQLVHSGTSEVCAQFFMPHKLTFYYNEGGSQLASYHHQLLEVTDSTILPDIRYLQQYSTPAL